MEATIRKTSFAIGIALLALLLASACAVASPLADGIGGWVNAERLGEIPNLKSQISNKSQIANHKIDERSAQANSGLQPTVYSLRSVASNAPRLVIYGQNGQALPADVVMSVEERIGSFTVHNMIVEDWHSYVVAGGVVVHNGNPCAGATRGGFNLPGATKSEARQAVEGMGLPLAQQSSVSSAVQRATSTSTVKVTQHGPDVLVEIFRPGKEGFQVIETVVRPGGAKTVVQKAYDAAGNMVHYHPK